MGRKPSLVPSRKPSKKGKGLPSSVGKFDVNAGLQANAFTQVKTKNIPEGKRQLPVRARSNGAGSGHGGGVDEAQGGYESMPRSFEKSQKKKKGRLPIKTQEGIIRHVEAESEEEEEEGGQQEGGSGVGR